MPIGDCFPGPAICWRVVFRGRRSNPSSTRIWRYWRHQWRILGQWIDWWQRGWNGLGMVKSGVLSCLDDYRIPDDRLVPDTTSAPGHDRLQSPFLMQLHAYNKLDSMIHDGIFRSGRRQRNEPLCPAQMLPWSRHTFYSNFQYEIVHPIHIPHIVLPVP